MPVGTLEVLLASANGIKSGDFFSKTDAYAIVTCGTQTQKSNVARNQGSNPTWNQRFLFSLDEGVQEITLKIMDEDFMTADDELGLVTVPLQGVFQFGKTGTTGYNVVKQNGKNKGEVKISLSFTPKQRADSFQYGAPGNNTQNYSFHTQGSEVQGPHSSFHAHGAGVPGPYGSFHAQGRGVPGPYGSFHAQGRGVPDPYGSFHAQGRGAPDPYGSFHAQGRGAPDPYGSFHAQGSGAPGPYGSFHAQGSGAPGPYGPGGGGGGGGGWKEGAM